MRDYEMTAFELIEQLKMKQGQESAQEEELITRNFMSKQSATKDLIEMKK